MHTLTRNFAVIIFLAIISTSCSTVTGLFKEAEAVEATSTHIVATGASELLTEATEQALADAVKEAAEDPTIKLIFMSYGDSITANEIHYEDQITVGGNNETIAETLLEEKVDTLPGELMAKIKPTNNQLNILDGLMSLDNIVANETVEDIRVTFVSDLSKSYFHSLDDNFLRLPENVIAHLHNQNRNPSSLKTIDEITFLTVPEFSSTVHANNVTFWGESFCPAFDMNCNFVNAI